jgi:peptidoglycan/LPS O-acetylase OafA/YrhL
MKLSSYTQGRDNNFNLIRILAAFTVLLSHSFILSTGNGETEPVQNTIGMTLGAISVDIFFVASGFLVTASLLNKQCLIDFIWARVLRIFPALIIMVFITVFGLGIFFTSFPLNSYLTDSKTYTYLLKCSSIIKGVVYELPGVFGSNPYKLAVNGSLWTMPYEIKMYEILAASWALLYFTKNHRIKLFKFAILAGTAVSCFLVFYRHFYLLNESQSDKLFFMFFSGASFYILKEHIRLSSKVFLFFLTSLIASAFFDIHLFFSIYELTLAYLLFYLAYVPSGVIRSYNQVGDYSYGFYIYAFPVQQSIAALVPNLTVYTMIIVSTLVTLCLASISWHIVEKHALKLRINCVCKTKEILYNIVPVFIKSFNSTRQ